MFAYEPSLNPPCDEWKEYTLPHLCKERIEEICKDILKKGETTFYKDIYAAIYELAEADIHQEFLEGLV